MPGQIGESWSDRAGGMTITIESEGEGPPVTTLTGTLDQAALQGLLRRLYSLGLPLISVNYVKRAPDDDDELKGTPKRT